MLGLQPLLQTGPSGQWRLSEHADWHAGPSVSTHVHQRPSDILVTRRAAQPTALVFMCTQLPGSLTHVLPEVQRSVLVHQPAGVGPKWLHTADQQPQRGTCVCMYLELLKKQLLASVVLRRSHSVCKTHTKCCFWFQRLAIELFRRQTSRSSSPPDLRLATGTTSSEREPRSVKSDDDIQASLNSTKKGEEEEATQHDDSNVRRAAALGKSCKTLWICCARTMHDIKIWQTKMLKVQFSV